MMTPYEYIELIQNNEKEAIRKDITLYQKIYDINPSNNSHIPELIKEKNATLNSDNMKEISGWPYFENVCYLDEDQMNNLSDVMSRKFGKKYDLSTYPKEKIFAHLNKIAWLEIDLDRLNLTQAKYNPTRLKNRKPPIKELEAVLEWIGENHEMSRSINQLLENFLDGDFTPPKLNLEWKENIKQDIINEKNALQKTIWNYQTEYAPEATKEILQATDLS